MFGAVFGAWVFNRWIFRISARLDIVLPTRTGCWQLVIGIVGIIVGLLTFHAPQVTALALIIYIAAWALMIGASEIVLAIKMRRKSKANGFDPYGSGIDYLCHTVSVESYAGAAAVIWAHRMVRGRTRHSWHFFFGSDCAALRNVGSLLKNTVPAKRASWASLGTLLGIRDAHFCAESLFFCATKQEPAGLLKKIRLGATDGAITLRRWI